MAAKVSGLDTETLWRAVPLARVLQYEVIAFLTGDPKVYCFRNDKPKRDLIG